MYQIVLSYFKNKYVFKSNLGINNAVLYSLKMTQTTVNFIIFIDDPLSMHRSYFISFSFAWKFTDGNE